MKITELQLNILLRIADDSLRVDDMNDRLFSSRKKERLALVTQILKQQSRELRDVE